MFRIQTGCVIFPTVLCSMVAAWAQQTSSAVMAVPRLVHFAGSYQSSVSRPAGPVGATFAIFSEQEGGTALWSEDQNVDLDANGNYTVQLGATKNGGVPLDLFSGTEARWLQVDFHLPANVTMPRVLLVSVPYALKAADAETIGGLPPSAFVLAALPTAGPNSAAAASNASDSQPAASPALTGSGSAGFIPRWTNNSDLGNSVVFQSGTGSTGKIGINTTTPASTLDVNGATFMRGTVTLIPSGTATASSGDNSEPFNLNASAFNSGAGSAKTQSFRLQAEPTGNNTSSPGGTLNLLFGAGGATPVETGLSIASNGQITFAPGQTFPGSGGGTVTSVGSGAGLTGGPITGAGTLSIATAGVTNSMLANPSLTVGAGTGLTGGGAVSLGGSTTLSLDTTKVPLLSAANIFTGNQTVNGNLSATGVVTGSSYQIGSTLFASGSTANSNAFVGFSGNSVMTGTGNTGNGVSALHSNVTGCCNTADGDLALNDNTGSFNTAIGFKALLFNLAGSYNNAFGSSALFGNTTGTGNTAVGQGAIGANTTGSYNTAVGYVSGQSSPINYQVSGNYNTFIGYQSGPTSQSPVSNATTLGANAAVGESNALILGGTGSNAVSVGIGTAAPYFDYALDVEATPNGAINGGVVADSTGGNIYLGMTNRVHKFRVDLNGVVYADGGFQSSGADFAESFAVRGPRSLYEPGDVLVIDQKADRHLAKSQRAYATLVAGIYSTKPGMLATPHHIDDPTVQQSEVPLAVVGIVPCKVTAENGAITRGDLLVTSSRPGYAMKGTNRRRMLGAVVGKALEPLPKGTGVIQVLVTLQ